jgi:hypothetical protein
MLTVPIDMNPQKPVGVFPALGVRCYQGSVVGHHNPIILPSRQRASRHGIDEVGDDLFHQVDPFRGPPCVSIELRQPLHRAYHQVPPTIGSGQISGVQKIHLLCRQSRDDVAIAILVLAEVVISQCPHYFREGASRGDALLRVVLLEKASEEPRQRRMDAVITSAKRRQQPRPGGSIEQRDGRLASQSLHFRQAPLRLRMPHRP